MKTLSQCVEIVAAPLTRSEKLDALFDCVRTFGVYTRDNLMDIFDLGLPLLSHENSQNRRDFHQFLMTAQAQFIAHVGLKTPQAKELLEEFYIDLLYEQKDYMWFDHMKNHGLLRAIESNDFPNLFDQCCNAEKLSAVLSSNLFDVEDEIFGVQSWLTTSLAQSANVFALRGFAQSLRHLLCNFNDEKFCFTVQVLLEEMAQYGLYTHVLEHKPKTDFFVELFDHKSAFNQLLPVQARVNHRSMLQRLDLLLHDISSLDAEVIKIFLPALEEPYPSAVVVQCLGGYLSDMWSNSALGCPPQIPGSGSSEWPAPIFDQVLKHLSIQDRLHVLYMALGRMRPENSLTRTEQSCVVAHLPWMKEAWALRVPSLSEERWEEYEDDNLCNYMVPVRSLQGVEDWIAALLTRLELCAQDAATATEDLPESTVINGLKCTPWPQQLLRKHPLVQQAILSSNLPDNSVSTVKKM